MTFRKKLIVILGPTASGKTKLAVSLASKFNGEIVSADSRQVYQEIDIGTGKDLNDYRFKIYDLRFKKKVIKKMPYHLINIIQPKTEFNVAKYKKLALKAIADIHCRGKVPFLVGGTGLYISAIVDNYEIPKVGPNKKVRRKLEKLNKFKKLAMLKKLDPAAFDFVDVNNPRRLDRALEVCLSGQKFSEVRKKGQSFFNVLQLGLSLPKNVLNKRIDERIKQMIKNCLVEETKNLIKKYGQDTAPLQTIGYKEIVEYLNNNVETRHALSLQKTIDLIKIHTHQFAKRQMTWFKRDKRIRWIKKEREAEKLVKEFLRK